MGSSGINVPVHQHCDSRAPIPEHQSPEPRTLNPIVPFKKDRIWGIWGSYRNIPTAMYYLLMWNYKPLTPLKSIFAVYGSVAYGRGGTAEGETKRIMLNLSPSPNQTRNPILRRQLLFAGRRNSTGSAHKPSPNPF